jgi:hypothetical protein
LVVPRGSFKELILGGKPSSRSWHTIVCHGRLYFGKNSHTLLSYHDVHLADNIDFSTLHMMPIDQKREWVRHFETAKDSYDKERQRTRQKTILEYLTPLPNPTRQQPTQRSQYHPPPPPQRNSPRCPKDTKTTHRHTYNQIRTPTNDKSRGTTNPHHTIAPPRPPKLR